ncbi:hypothetical protein H6P81_014325 [Aristolochia fimbriata]|uniref:Uncharacterized protein n=1 Tax=Aristolochia fimbriata TaxID=158543 RepID=A0AAV7EKU2_ARIFI|nr:hypothetical protein H6P81_014325 [Aristolochia fimbriata]
MKKTFSGASLAIVLVVFLLVSSGEMMGGVDATRTKYCKRYTPGCTDKDCNFLCHQVGTGGYCSDPETCMCGCGV